MGSSFRTYQVVPCALWDDDDFLGLSDVAQKVFIYLLTTKHSNILGLYLLKEGYALEDLNFSEPKKYRTALAEIQESHLIDYDVGNSVVLIKKYHLTANPVVSPNQIKAIKYIIGALPKTHLVYALKELIRDPAVIERGKNEEVLDELEKLAPGEIFRNDAPGTTLGEIKQKGPRRGQIRYQVKKDANALGDIWNDICGHVFAHG